MVNIGTICISDLEAFLTSYEVFTIYFTTSVSNSLNKTVHRWVVFYENLSYFIYHQVSQSLNPIENDSLYTVLTWLLMNESKCSWKDVMFASNSFHLQLIMIINKAKRASILFCKL